MLQKLIPLLFTISLVRSISIPLTLRDAQASSLFNNVTVFAPPASWASHATSYARSLLLNNTSEKEDNTVLGTWSFSPPDGTYLPIYNSTDGGQTWAEFSKLNFTHKNYEGGAILHPFLFELPVQIGNYSAGTILGTGTAIPPTFASTNIELYASSDGGSTWKFVSVVATGGPPSTTNGATPVWEPFISVYDGQVLVYYSDQRDPLHGQKISLQTSKDLTTWGGIINATAYDEYKLRPGMATVTQIGNGSWILSYELGFSSQGSYAVNYRIADSPLEFGNSTPQLLQAQNTNKIPFAGPYTIWTPSGGSNGTIVVSDSTYSQVFTNTNNGDPKSWKEVTTGIAVSYTRGLQITPNDSVILFMNGGLYDASNTVVTASEWLVPGS